MFWSVLQLSGLQAAKMLEWPPSTQFYYQRRGDVVQVWPNIRRHICFAVSCPTPSPVPCYATRCSALQCSATLCYAMRRYATLCYAMLCYATLCYAMLRYATLCYAMLR